MKINKNFSLLLFGILILSVSAVVFAQTPTLLKRTDYKNEKFDFGVGGTVSVTGAPNGSISIEGWKNNEVEVTAEITNEAATEADLALLAKVNGFVIDDTFGKIRIISVGTFDKKHVKKFDKKFLKYLLEMPFRIDYKIKVPFYTDLEINGGKGDFELSNIDGAMRINLIESNAKFNLVGGMLDATVGSGTVDVAIPTRSWRGQGTTIQLASGTMNVFMPLNFNADLDATILRSGKIENAYNYLKPRDRTKFSEKLMIAKAGNGGVSLKFTVGEGSLNLAQIKTEKAQK
ncbi:MAG: hypothetical protein ABIP06_07615 [Pyrinomonadaceae bacterium]